MNCYNLCLSTTICDVLSSRVTDAEGGRKSLSYVRILIILYLIKNEEHNELRHHVNFSKWYDTILPPSPVKNFVNWPELFFKIYSHSLLRSIVLFVYKRQSFFSFRMPLSNLSCKINSSGRIIVSCGLPSF